MSTQPQPDQRLTFLVDDYKSKVQYLKDHFTRLWTRFNYFLTLQSALFGAAILSPEKYHWWVPIFGAILCILWYLFGAQDRYLVDLYRKQIEHDVIEIKSKLKLSDYYFIGQTENIDGQSEKLENLGTKMTIYQWRNKYFSTTKLLEFRVRRTLTKMELADKVLV